MVMAMGLAAALFDSVCPGELKGDRIEVPPFEEASIVDRDLRLGRIEDRYSHQQ